MNRRTLVLAGGLLLLLLLGTTAYVVTKDDGDSEFRITDVTRGPVKSVEVDPDQATSASLGGTSVSLRSGSVTEPATLSLARGVASPPKGSEFVGRPVSITLDHPLERDATVTLPTGKEPHSRAVPGYFDPGTGHWLVVDEFRTQPSGFQVKTSHFTLFGVLRFAGYRADQPKCPKPAGGGVVRFASGGFEENRMLFACANSNKDGSATVKVVNNRSYLMPVEFPQGTKVGVPFGSDLPEWGIQALSKAAHAGLPGNTVLVPPGATAEVQVPVGAPPYLIKPHPKEGIAAVGLILDALAEFKLPGQAWADLVNCAYRGQALLSGRAGFNGSEVLHLVDDCSTKAMQSVPERQAKLRALKKALGGLLIVEAMAVVHDAHVDQAGAGLSVIAIKPPRPAVESWRLSAVGIGPIRLGMDEAEARAVAPGLISTAGQFCDSWKVDGLDGVNMLAPPGGLRSIGVADSRHAPAGVGRGASLSTLTSTFGSRLSHEPVETGSLNYDYYYYFYSPDRQTTIQFVVDLKTEKVLYVEAGYPGEFYFPSGTEICA